MCGQLFFFCGSLDGPLGQSQLVCGFCIGTAFRHLGLYLAAGAACSSLHGGLRCLGGKAAAVGIEVTALGSDDLARFLSGSFQCLFPAGHLQHGASTQAVDVAVDKGIRVAAQHGDQHLVERHTCRAVGVGDAPRSVAGAHAHGFIRSAGRSRSWCRSCHDWLGGRCGRADAWAGGVSLACDRYRCWSSDLRCGDLRCRSSCRCCAARGGRRVQQQGVAALHAAGVPLRVHDQIDKGIVQWRIAAQLQQGGAIRLLDQLHIDGAGCSAVVQTAGSEGFGGRDLHNQVAQLCRRGLWNGNFSAQVLAQRRVNAQCPQGQGRGTQAGECGGGKGGRGQS